MLYVVYGDFLLQPIFPTIDAFDYDLPPELIAQTPVEPRDSSRLMVIDRAAGTIEHTRFRDLPRYLVAGDLLVANESRVLRMRLFGRKATGGKIETLLLRQHDDLSWEALVRGKHIGAGARLHFGEGEGGVGATVLETLPHGGRLIRFDRAVEPLLPSLGVVPLPPYIHTILEDDERYQTVYSRTPGSAAAPTAGLHFTPDLLARLQCDGIEWATVLLHVGLDTFRPVQVDNIAEHTMHSEWYQLDDAGATALNQARERSGRIVAVGTTAVRVLETAARDLATEGVLVPSTGDTNIFIYPPYQFKLVGGLITNFHLPRSTLLMLVSAFAGYDLVRRAYAEAVEQRYRFFSFGDAMLIL